MPLSEENSSKRETERLRFYRMHCSFDELWEHYLEAHPEQTQLCTTVKELMDWSYEQTERVAALNIPQPAKNPDAQPTEKE